MMNRCLPALLLLACLCTTGRAQEMFVQPPARLITRFPFEQLIGGVVVIKAHLQGQPAADSLRFIFDTGSGGISLDSSTVARLGLRREPSNRTIRGIAGIKTVDFVNHQTLHLPGLSTDSLNFHINDYELLTGVYGVKIDGIMGFSVLRRYVVAIDYDQRQISFYQPGEYRYPKGGYLLRPAIAGLPMQYAELADSRSMLTRFYLDTGAGLNLLLSNEFAADSALLSPRRRRYPTVAEGLGGKRFMDISLIKSIRLGSYKFRNVPVYLFDDTYNVTSYPQLGGLIGNDLLRRFNVVINYPRSEFHLLPNSHFREPFDYSYTGLGLYQEGDAILVSDVIAGSPADQAGLKVGDRIVAIDNNISNSMQAYRTALQQAGRKLKLIVGRGDKVFETQLIIRSVRNRRAS